MQVENWPISRVTPYPTNARKISEAAVEKVAASIREFGWRQPIVVSGDGVVIVGHARLLAARKLGLGEVPVHVATELTPQQVRAYRLMDNRSHDESLWDYDLLGAELLDLKGLEIDLSLTGFDLDEIAEFTSPKRAGLTDEDAAPARGTVAFTRPGDLWVLGRHRLLCGDATRRQDVQRLMGGQRGDLAFTDPPYNVEYEGYTEERLTIQGDAMSAGQFGEFLRATCESLAFALKREASAYVCHPSLYQREFENALESADFAVRCQIIWAKNTFAWGFGRYKFQHEPIFYCHRKGQSDPWYGDKSQSTLWQEKKPAANRLHPTMKPVELVERALANSSKAGSVVVDLFGGSGSTMIACERMGGRTAAMLELDPLYADVIVKRWQDFTGEKARREDGAAFEELDEGAKSEEASAMLASPVEV